MRPTLKLPFDSKMKAGKTPTTPKNPNNIDKKKTHKKHLTTLRKGELVEEKKMNSNSTSMMRVTADDDDNNNNNEQQLAECRQKISELQSLLLEALQKNLKLEDLPLELQNDREFVLAAIRKYENWYDLPQKWKDDAEVACAAFETNRMYLPKKGRQYIGTRHVGRPILRWIDLPYHLKINKKVLVHALQSQNGPKWKDIPIQFQTNEDLLSTAVLYQKISFEDVPLDIQKNNPQISLYGVLYNHIEADDCPCLSRDFLKQVLEDGELNWDQLPTPLMNDVDFALSISRFKDQKLPGQILEHLFESRSNRIFWRKLLYSPGLISSPTGYDIFMHLLERYLPPDLCSDHEFMLEMSRECTEAFSVVDRNLASDRKFLELALGQNAAVLKFLPHEIQQLNRDLVVKAIKSLGKSRDKNDYMAVYYVEKALRPSFWMDYDFAMTWVMSGLGFPSNSLPDDVIYAWMDDRGLCLANAVQNKSLQYVAPQFLQDIPFMLEVVTHHPWLYLKAQGAAKSDLVVMTTAFAGCPDLAGRVMSEIHLKGQDQEIHNYLDYLRNKLDPYESFFECILGNMLSTQSLESTGSPLTLLNQGLETSNKYKILLAEYLDIPTGKWLCQLQQAEENVLNAIAPWAHEYD